MKSRVTAALLAFFLGAFGAHKFYLGDSGKGILYLLFFWTYIPALIAFVEAIIYLTMDEAEFQRRYGRGMLPAHVHQQALPAPQPAPQAAPTQNAQNVTINMPPQHGGAGGGSLSDELRKLHELHKEGVLDDEEFRAQKKKLLG